MSGNKGERQISLGFQEVSREEYFVTITQEYDSENRVTLITKNGIDTIDGKIYQFGKDGENYTEAISYIDNSMITIQNGYRAELADVQFMSFTNTSGIANASYYTEWGPSEDFMFRDGKIISETTGETLFTYENGIIYHYDSGKIDKTHRI